MDDPAYEDADAEGGRSFKNRHVAAALLGVVLLASTALAMFLWPKREIVAPEPSLFLRLEASAPAHPSEIEKRVTNHAEAALLQLPRVRRASSYTDSTGAAFSILYTEKTDLGAAEGELRTAVEGLRERVGRTFERFFVARKTTPYNWPVKPMTEGNP